MMMRLFSLVVVVLALTTNVHAFSTTAEILSRRGVTAEEDVEWTRRVKHFLKDVELTRDVVAQQNQRDMISTTRKELTEMVAEFVREQTALTTTSAMVLTEENVATLGEEFQAAVANGHHKNNNNNDHSPVPFYGTVHVQELVGNK